MLRLLLDFGFWLRLLLQRDTILVVIGVNLSDISLDREELGACLGIPIFLIGHRNILKRRLFLHPDVQTRVVILEVPILASRRVLAKHGRLNRRFMRFFVKTGDQALLLLDLVIESRQLVLIVVLLAFKGKDLILEWPRLSPRSLHQQLLQLVDLLRHLLLRHIRLVLRMLLHKLLLPCFQVTNLLIDFHLLLVVSRLVLDASVQEKAELVGLMDAIYEHCQQRHLLMLRKCSHELRRLDTN